jgi:hypothetical protein
MDQQHEDEGRYSTHVLWCDKTCDTFLYLLPCHRRAATLVLIALSISQAVFAIMVCLGTDLDASGDGIYLALQKQQLAILEQEHGTDGVVYRTGCDYLGSRVESALGIAKIDRKFEIVPALIGENKRKSWWELTMSRGKVVEKRIRMHEYEEAEISCNVGFGRMVGVIAGVFGGFPNSG